MWNKDGIAKLWFLFICHVEDEIWREDKTEFNYVLQSISTFINNGVKVRDAKLKEQSLSSIRYATIFFWRSPEGSGACLYSSGRSRVPFPWQATLEFKNF